MSSLKIRQLAVAALVGLSLPLGVAAAAKCYGIDGSTLDDSFVPCNPDAEVSACCPSNKNNGDICMSSGLCYAQVGGFQGLVFSNGCTDKTGKSKNCPHVCPDSTNDWNGGDPVASWNVLQCNATAFCCRHSNDGSTCCNDDSKVINNFSAGNLLLASLTASGAKATVTNTAACSSGDSSSSSSGSDSSCPKDNSAVVGGAVGGVLGAALLGALGAIAMLLKRRKNHHAEAVPAAEEVTASDWHRQQEQQHKYSNPQTPASHELDEHVQRHEM